MSLRINRRGTVSYINNHDALVGKELANQHPIASITDLQKILDQKYVKPANGIPIDDLGFDVATITYVQQVQELLNNRVDVTNANVEVNKNNITALQEFLENLFPDGDTSVPDDQTIRFAYREGFREEFLSEEGDVEFMLYNRFVADTKHLRVYRDGELLIPEQDYIEVDDHTIRMLSPLPFLVHMSFICDSMSNVLSPIHEEIIALENQTEYKLKNTYNKGDHSLSIYVNGLRLELGVHYEEVSIDTIRLLATPYPAGTKLIFRQEIVTTNGQVLYNDKDYSQASWLHEYIASAGDRIIDLPEPYIPSANMIKVTGMGLVLGCGDAFDYIELNDRQIQFNYDLEEGEKITVMTTVGMYNWCERFVSLRDQVVYQLKNVFYTGRNDIIVYENGVQLAEGDDYIEVNGRTIKLLDVPREGSKILVYKRR